MTLMSQIELELDGYGYGRERAAQRIAERERSGKGADNPYSQPIYRRYVFPLSEALTAEQERGAKLRRKAAITPMLAPLHAENTALVVVRAALVHLVGTKCESARTLFRELGQAAYHEHLLEHFSDLQPDLFNQLSRGFANRMSKDERYRLNVVRDTARERGVHLPEWDFNDVERLGMWFANALHDLGMLDIETVQISRTEKNMVSRLTEDAMGVIESAREQVIENSPYFSPCVEPPKDWVSFDDGGYHTQEMRRLLPYAVKAQAVGRETLAAADLSRTLAALNAMQRTAWRINRRVMDTLAHMGGKVDLGEVLVQTDDPRPEKPSWMPEKGECYVMSKAEVQQFKLWKRETSKWYSKSKERVVKWGRYRQAMDAARKFRDYPAIYFVYFADYRDRKYALTNGVSPQGSDLQKALLEAAEGQPLLDDDAWAWFHITGANRYGFDKATLPARVQWCVDNHEDIIASAEDPIANRWWLKADKPLQFLAWSFEYADLHTFGRDLFVSRISVGMDGSCNGLQNFSAMLRDEVGGRATNLLPPENSEDVPNDIYGQVAERTEQRLIADVVPPPEAKLAKWLAQRGLRQKWLDHGMNRKITKRSVMTLPYGSTRFSCTEFIAGDYLAEGYAEEFGDDEHFAAASYLSGLVWPAIGDVVVKAREAMEWLQASAVSALSEHKVIRWVTPTGFPVVQAYWEENAVQINTKLCGRQKVLVRSPTNNPNKNKHRNGVAPNFIHSMDAAHLTRVAIRLEAEGITWMHMVHDDFGVRPGDAGKLYRIIREEFIAMYEGCDPLHDFAERYPDHCPPMPARGTLDLSCVMDSPYFFS